MKNGGGKKEALQTKLGISEEKYNNQKRIRMVNEMRKLLVKPR